MEDPDLKSKNSVTEEKHFTKKVKKKISETENIKKNPTKIEKNLKLKK